MATMELSHELGEHLRFMPGAIAFIEQCFGFFQIGGVEAFGDQA